MSHTQSDTPSQAFGPSSATLARAGLALLVCLTLAASLLVGVIPARPAQAQETNFRTVYDDEENYDTEDHASDLSTNAAYALAIAETAFPTRADRVLIARDDNYPDALGSGLLQSSSPLLLVPSEGPLPASISAFLRDRGTNAATILGGTAAVSERIEDDLRDLGLRIRRHAGASRFETAVLIAEERPSADTVLIARAYPAPGSSDPTQGFADALAAGAWAAAEGWPILLTGRTSLPTVVVDHLTEQGYDTAIIIGGRAAVPDSIQGELEGLVGNVERIAGASRFQTATMINERRDDLRTADGDRHIVIDGQDEGAWAIGFAMASMADRMKASVVLTAGERMPEETKEYLSANDGPADYDGEFPLLICTAAEALCDDAREQAGLPEAVDYFIDPTPGSPLNPGQRIEARAGADANFHGSCLSSGRAYRHGGPAIALTAANPMPTTCDLIMTTVLANGAEQRTQMTYHASTTSTASVGQVIINVRDTAGQAISGVPVSLTADGASVGSITTGADGRVDFGQRSTTQNHVASISAGGYLPASQTVQPDGVNTITLVRSSSIGFAVMDESGNRIAGVQITGSHAASNEVFSVTTDTDGAATAAELRPGTWSGTATAPGAQPQAFQVEAPEGQSTAHIITFAQAAQAGTARIFGQIADTNGAPVGGVTVTVTADGVVTEHQSDDQGFYNVTVDTPGSGTTDVQLQFAKSGYSTATHTAPVASDQELLLDAEITRGTLSGLVTDTSGNPVEGITVSLSFGQGGNPFFVPTYQTTTGPDGRYQLNEVSGSPYTLQFDGPNHGRATQQHFQSSGERMVVDHVATAPGRIAGQTTDGSFQARPNVTVTLEGPAQGQAVSNNGGSFEFADLTAGAYTVNASELCFTESVNVAEGENVWLMVDDRC